ncbi:hypothetical protein GF356_11640 [candidate division GN15 bacterium]|nr:hypothetical protein [candidate division GN15 bacterium]
MDRKVALAICFVFGVVMFIQYFSGSSLARQVNQSILEYWQIVFAFTLVVGIVGVVRTNVQRINKRDDVFFRIVTLAGIIIMPVVALIWGIKADTPFMWMFENIQAPMQATVFALLAFFVASASFRGFRARSVQATVLLVSASIILLSRSALGGILADEIPQFAEWMRNYPSMSARRAILIGIGLGSITTSLRVILGIERTWLGGRR